MIDGLKEIANNNNEAPHSLTKTAFLNDFMIFTMIVTAK